MKPIALFIVLGLLAGCELVNTDEQIHETGVYQVLASCSDETGFREIRFTFDARAPGLVGYLTGYHVFLGEQKVSTCTWSGQWDIPKFLDADDDYPVMISGSFRISSDLDEDPLVLAFYSPFDTESSAETQEVYFSLIPGHPEFINSDTTTYFPPDSILTKAQDYLVCQVGQMFFDEYFAYDCRASRRDDQDYRVSFRFRVPEKPYIDELITVALDSIGEVIIDSSSAAANLSCIESESNCEFPIDEATAIQIAREAGLEDGIFIIHTSFYWYGGDLKRYVWSVKNTTGFERYGYEFSGGGQRFTIDARTGEILKESFWMVIT
ncbi:MAG: hypothetical protein JSW54_09475 [Fidelibacterota bacterium]|nr:MAG: hypothetical protein JSW54_09475 [Candidatus Neomarinimicrobiota bacterium]